MGLTTSSGRRRVLVAEDEQRIRWILSQKLQAAGYEVFLAQDGREALELAREHQPNVVVTDCCMSTMDGIELCQALSEDPVTSEIPAILLTSYEPRALSVKIGDSNIAAMLTKPFSPAE